LPKRIWVLLVLTVLAASAVRAATAAAFETEYDLAARTILCDCGCSPQSVHDCACGRAAEMRESIAADIRSGKTGRQVIDEYVAKYGEKIRIAPSATGFNLVAWLGPGLALLGGAAVMMLVLRRWKRASEGPSAPAVLPPLAPDDPYVARLEKEMRDFR
jgi:cytochrome c-type biogenesis protein CcmH